MSVVSDIFAALPVFALGLFRIAGFVMVAPVVAGPFVPMRFRAALAMWVSIFVFPVVQAQSSGNISLSTAFGGLIAEVMIGLAIGLTLSIMLSAAELAGLIVGQQSGVAIAEIFDPTHDEQSSGVIQLYTLTFTLSFLLVGGHRIAISALLDTYTVIPVFSFAIEESLLILLVNVLGGAFILGIRIAAPVLLALFLLGVAMAFLSRTMPQLNILTVGFSVRLMVGLGVAAWALSASGDLIVDGVWDALDSIHAYFLTEGP